MPGRTPRSRVVVIGDLNGADDVLVDILRGTRLVDRDLCWIGGRAELVQLGDLFNRGGGALRAFRLLMALRAQAERVGGKVTVLLGNHEAMTALRHEGYCTEEEYLAFASAAERRAWPGRVARALRRLARQHAPGGVIQPIAPRLESWKLRNVPGRTALRRALGPRGAIGKALRALPIAHVSHDAVFVHAGLLPEWAKLGVERINERVREEWARAPRHLWSLPKTSVFRDPRGPLWDRSLTSRGPAARAALRRALDLLGVRRMIVGHTQTSAVQGGKAGAILLLHGGRLVMTDVGLHSGEHTPRTALILSGSEGYEWTPQRTRLLWDASGVAR